MRPLILVIVFGLVAAGAIGFLAALLVDENESTPLPAELVLPTPEGTEVPAVLATTSPDMPISETYGPGLVGRQRYRDRRFDDLSCTEAWSQGEALVYPRGSGEPFETAADVTGDGTPERVRSVLISMTGYVVAVQDEDGAFLFCDAGDRIVLLPLPDGTGFLESLELTGDNAHCCPEGEMRVAYEWSGQSFVPSWGMVRELADSDSNPELPASWECLFGSCPEVPPFVSAGAINDATSGEEVSVARAIATPTVQDAVPLLAFRSASGICSSDQLRGAEESVEIASLSQLTHQQWLDFLESRPGYDTSLVGSSEHHRSWVDRYQIIIDTLTTYSGRCRDLGGVASE